MNKNRYKLYQYLIKIFILIFVIIIFAFSDVLIYRDYKKRINNFDYLTSTNKVILFIGDGMGENHIKNSELYLNKKMVFSDFLVNGYVSTFSNDLINPTDSAAAATALATGAKVSNGQVAFNGKDILSISEIIKKSNKGVGIVTTDSLSGATPACFSSHASERGLTDEIIIDQINSNIDIFLGAGLETYQPYQERIENKGYDFINDYSLLSLNSFKIMGSFSQINNYDMENNQPTLKSLTSFAIDFLDSKYPNGYFLMVEGAHIDKMNHDNKINEMIKYLDEFNNAIICAKEKLSNSDYTLIVTADHETGSLKLSKDLDSINNNLYQSTGHSSNDVLFFIDFNKNIYDDFPKKIDNTDIFKICKKLME